MPGDCGHEVTLGGLSCKDWQQSKVRWFIDIKVFSLTSVHQETSPISESTAKETQWAVPPLIVFCRNMIIQVACGQI